MFNDYSVLDIGSITGIFEFLEIFKIHKLSHLICIDCVNEINDKRGLSENKEFGEVIEKLKQAKFEDSFFMK